MYIHIRSIYQFRQNPYYTCIIAQILTCHVISHCYMSCHITLYDRLNDFPFPLVTCTHQSNICMERLIRHETAWMTDCGWTRNVSPKSGWFLVAPHPLAPVKRPSGKRGRAIRHVAFDSRPDSRALDRHGPTWTESLQNMDGHSSVEDEKVRCNIHVLPDDQWYGLHANREAVWMNNALG